jgi:hypothetical protein
MNISHEILTKRINTIAALRKLLKDMDPASGVTVCIRRGVYDDSEEEDPNRRPWSIVECVDYDLTAEVIKKLIDSEQQSAKMWAKSIKSEIDKCTVALETYEKHLKIP